MDGFEPARNQDAWATFRGFVYQVDLTLLRWIAFRDDGYLELECGEDIDAVARAVSDSGDDTFVRTLEQVKVREHRISLRSSEALTTLANSYANFIGNEGLDLRFCYSTNAKMACERPNPFPNGDAGIKLWEDVRRQSLDEEQELEAVEALCSFLTNAVRPKKVLEETWLDLINLLKNAPQYDVIDFIRRFTWSCGVDSPESLREKVKQQLASVVAKTDTNMIHIDELYNRLFLHVLQLLTQSGPKRLTHALLIGQLSAPTLSDSNHQLLLRVGGRLGLVEERVAQVESTVKSISATVKTLAKNTESDLGKVHTTALPSTGMPLLAENMCPRTDTVQRLIASSSDTCWLALYGTTHTGKTHLVSLLSSHRQRRDWFRFRHDMSPAQAAVVFRATAFCLAEKSSVEAGDIPYREICRVVQPGAVILLDDLPRMQDDDPLAECLANLTRYCRAEDVSVISSSRFRLPSRLTSLLGQGCVSEVATPSFTNSEAATLLANLGATEDQLSDALVAVINRLASGHPFLLTQAGRYLEQQEWRLDKDNLNALLRGDHTTGLTDELLTRLCTTLSTPQRDLLYRVSLASRSLSAEIISNLAEIAPKIERSPELLANLNGAWLQREESNKYVVSPVATNILNGNVRGRTGEQCHVVLGQGITSVPMDPWDAHAAICHFRSGRAYDLAGLLLIDLLQESQLHSHVKAYKPILSIWCSEPLPVEMHGGIKLMVRAMQFWTFPNYAIPDEKALADLDRLMSQLSPELAAPAFQVASLAMLFLSQRSFARSHYYYSQAITAIRDSSLDTGELDIASKDHPVELLWTTITSIQSVEDLDCWTHTFESLTSDEQELVMQSCDARLGCMVLADRLMLVESYCEEESRQWLDVLNALHKLYDWALDQDWAYLAACVIKSETNVCGEYLKEQTPNLARVTQFVDYSSHDEPAKALVAGMYGKMLAGSGVHSKALPWLQRAVDAETVYEGHERLMTLLAAAKCCRGTPSEALAFTQKAVDLVVGNASISSTEATRAYIEHAIAEIGQAHTQENAIRCFPAWNEAAQSMFASTERDDDWKELFVIFGHAHSFFCQLAFYGEVPDQACDGSPYAAPFQGFTATSHSERLDFFHAESIPGILWFQSLYARATGDSESADEWLKRADEEIESLPITHVTAMVRQEMLPQLLASNQFDEAFQAGIQGTLASVALKEFATQDDSPPSVPHATPLETLVGRMTEDGERLAQRFTLITTALPVLMRIATIAIEDSDTAREEAQQVASLCRQMSHGSCEPRYWDGAAKVYEAVADGEDSKALVDLANTFDSATDQELRIMGYLAVSTGDTLEASFGTQLASIEVLMSWYPPDSATYAKVLLPFIERYWSESFNRERFNFRSPALVEPALQEATKLPSQKRVQGILKAIRPAFKVHGLSDANAWLDASES